MKITKEFLNAEIDRKQAERQQVVVTGRRGKFAHDYENTGLSMRLIDAQIDVLRDLRDVLDEPEVPA